MNKTLKIIDLILWLVLMILVIYAYVDGQFIKKEITIIETCNGQPNINVSIDWEQITETTGIKQPEQEIKWELET